MSETEVTLEKSIKDLLNQYESKNEIFIEKTKSRFSEIQNFPNRCNVLVIGKTGVGKSTLINSIFRKELAESGSGAPVTQAIEQFSQDGCPITIYDTVGLEVVNEIELPSEVEREKEKEKGHISVVKKEVASVISQREEDVQNQIHLIWYCINSSSDRLEQAEETWIKELSEQDIPIILVLTKTLAEEEYNPFLQYLRKQTLPVEGILPILALPTRLSVSYVKQPFNLQELVRVSAEHLTTNIREVFIQEQIVNIELTELEARKYVVGYAALAGATGLIPIPGVDIPLIIQVQGSMVAHILNLFGIPPDERFLGTLIAVIAGASGGLATSNVTANVLKSVPGLGTVTGEIISGIAASAITASVGNALIRAIKGVRSNQAYQTDFSISDGEQLVSAFMEEYNTYLSVSDE